MKYKLEKEGGLYIEEINELDKEQIRVLVGAFKIKDPQAPQMGDKILSDVDNGKLEFETIKRFSKWCNTGVRYVKAQEMAREINYFFFDDLLIPRLCDQEDRTHERHVESYKNFLAKLRKSGLLVETEQYKKFSVTFYDKRGILLYREFDLEK